MNEKRCDLDAVVTNYNRVKAVVSPILSLKSQLYFFYTWSDPKQSICLLFATSVCLLYPEYFQCLFIGAVSLVFGLGYLSQENDRNTNATLSNFPIINATDFINPRYYSLEPESNRPTKVTDDSYRRMLTDINQTTLHILEISQSATDILNWKDYELTKRVVAGLLFAGVLPVFISINYVMFFLLVLTFCYNRYFVNFVASTILNQTTIIISPPSSEVQLHVSPFPRTATSSPCSSVTPDSDEDTFSESEGESHDVDRIYQTLEHNFCVQCSASIVGRGMPCQLCSDYFCSECCSIIVKRLVFLISLLQPLHTLAVFLNIDKLCIIGNNTSDALACSPKLSNFSIKNVWLSQTSPRLRHSYKNGKGMEVRKLDLKSLKVYSSPS